MLEPQPKSNIWEQNPKLKALLLILIFVFLFSGIGLAAFGQWSQSYKQKIYEQTQAGLPVHKALVSPSPTPSEDLRSDNQNVVTPDVSVAGWQNYADSKIGFSVDYPKAYEPTTGKIAANSTLGTSDQPVGGVYIGPFVFVELTSQDLKSQAMSKIQISNMKSVVEGKMQSATCSVQNISNTSAQVGYIFCSGEGGAAYAAYISGKTKDIFVDGYSCGYDNTCDVYGASPGKYANAEDFKKILSSFKFTK